MFLPQTLLDAAAPPVAQEAANQARNAFLFNLLSGDIGGAYNQAQSQGYGVISNAQERALRELQVQEARRKADAQTGLLQAYKDHFISPTGEIDTERLLSDSRYLLANPNDTSALKTATELRLARQKRETQENLARRYTRPDGTVDAVAMSQDREYVALLGDDPSKLKTVNEMRIGNLDRETSVRLASKHLNQDGTVNFAKMARDPEYIAQFGGDVSKAKTAAELAASEERRLLLEGANKATPLTGAPGTPSAQAQVDAAKKSYNDRITRLTDLGLYEEAAKLTTQAQALFPEEKFGQSIQFGTINGKRGGFVLGDRGTMKRIEGVQDAPSATAVFNASVPQIRDSENGLVRVNPLNGAVSPVIGKDGKQVQGTAGKVIETDAGVYRIQGNNAVPISGPGGQPLPGKVGAGTEDERKAAGFFTRMQQAEKGMQAPALDKSGKPVIGKDGKPLTLEQVAGLPQVSSEMARTILPGFLGSEAIGNFLDSAQRQKYKQYQENWVRANLRAESGAAIGVDEMEKEIRTYFPQINDTPEKIAQKAEARKVTADAMRKRAGRGLRDTAPPPPGGAAPTELFPAPPAANNTLNNIYNNYGLTPPSRP